MRPPPAAGRPSACGPLLGLPSDRSAGLGIEEMQPLRVEREAHLIANLHAYHRRDGRDHSARADFHVQKRLGSELLDYFDDAIEAQLAGIGAGREPQVLGTNSECKLLTQVSVQPVSPGVRRLDAKARTRN